MKPGKTSLILATCAVTALLGAAAIAQTQAPSPAAPDTAPALNSRRGPGGWGEFGGRGGMMGPGQMRSPGMQQHMPGLSEADRAAFFEARLASIKAGLVLSDTQLQLWPAVEAAMREMSKQRQDVAERVRKEGQPANPADRMKRAGEVMSARGAAMTKMADAMKPLYESLTDDQKRRLQVLTRGRMFVAHHGMSDHHRRGYGEGMRGGQGQGWTRGDGRRWNQDWPQNRDEPARNEWRRL